MELNEYVKKKKEKSHYYFHLSDLHFGNNRVEKKRERLNRLLENELSTMNLDDVGFIITGDAIDTPSITGYGENLAEDFSKFLKSKRRNKELIQVLGNHDLSPYGLKVPFFHKKAPLGKPVEVFPKIIIDHEIRVLFLPFTSNIVDNIKEDWWARGKIGEQQMLDMGNELDRLRKEQPLGGYTLVAILHHHVTEFRHPEFYKRYRLKKYLTNENTLCLIDSRDFLDWLKKRNVTQTSHNKNKKPP